LLEKKTTLNKNQTESLQTTTGCRHELLESLTALTLTRKQTSPGQVTTVRSHLALQSMSWKSTEDWWMEIAKRLFL